MTILLTVDGWQVKHGLSLPEVAFRWLQHHSELGKNSDGDAIIIGPSSIEQMYKNLAWKYVFTLILAL
jgi:aryl-alcohol dehydrogenase-like predicted oxidoreductase